MYAFLLALVEFLIPIVQGSQDELPVLSAGERVNGEITDEAPEVHTPALDAGYTTAPTVGIRYLILVDEAGPYHIDLRSYDFDAYLVLEGPEGALLVEDDDGLLGLHSRVVVQAEAGVPYVVTACALHGLRGTYEVRLVVGQPPVIDPRQRAELEEEDLRRRVERAEVRFGPEHLETAQRLNNLAKLLRSQGRHQAARPLLERVLAIREKGLDSMHLEIVEARGVLGHSLWQLGHYEEARTQFELAYAVRAETQGPEHPATLRCLFNIAEQFVGLADYGQAQALYEQVLASQERTLGPEHPDVAWSLNNLAGVLKNQGDYAAARPLYERALAVFERARGPEHSDTGKALNNLAVLLMAQGDYAAARPLCERALAIDEKALGPEHPATATRLNNLARLLHRQGSYEAARPLYAQALAIHEKALGPEHPRTATSLNNLAALFQDQRNYEAARPLYERALAIDEEALGPDHPQTAADLNNLAALFQDQRNYEAARPLYERALAIDEEALGPEHPETALCLNNLAQVLKRQGNYAAARPHLERALAIWEKALGSEHPLTALSLHNLAILLADIGAGDHALDLALRAGRGRSLHLARVLATQREHESYAHLAQTIGQLEFTLSGIGSSSSGAEAAPYEELIAWKGQIQRLLRSSRARMAEERSEEQERILVDLRATQSALSRLALATEIPDRERHDARMRELRERRETLELEWVRSLDQRDRVEVTFESLRGSLPPSSALVDFFVHKRYEPARREGEEVVEPGSWTEPHLSAWVTRPSSTVPIHLDLGPASDVEGAVRAFLQDLTSARGIGSGEQEGADTPAELRGRLWDPIAPYLEGVETVIISPDSFMGTLPFEVLQDASGRFLIEERGFVYREDAASLALSREETVSTCDSLLSLGGVSFRERAALVESDRASESLAVLDALRSGFDYWEPLTATLGESSGVFAMHEDTFGEGTRLLLQGTEGTEERLKRELPHHAVAHLATHGFFQPEGLPNMWEEARGQAGEPTFEMREPMKRLVGNHPGLLSGLVCAGANAEPEEGRDDGYLTAEEVSWLDLSKVELVVLSACETGLGRAQSGEGLIGLRRAFRTAGAKTVVSSLWSVRDESTAELMRAFYKNLWIEGMGKLEALREAQLAMLRKNRIEQGAPLPSTWGAFVLSGDWE